MPSAWRLYVRPQDFVWVLLFAALAVVSPGAGRNHTFISTVLIALGFVQVLEPKMPPLTTIVLKLALCYALLRLSGDLESGFYVMLLLPVISAATAFGLIGTALVAVFASLEYLSLLFFYAQPEFVGEGQLHLALRCLSFLMVGYFTHQLAAASREETRKLQATAEQLANANRDLQEAEAQVRRAERLAALGQLTAGLAHELRNPLGTMKSSAELLMRNVPAENAIAVEMAGYIGAEVDRTNSLITRFLDFARPQHLRMEQGDLLALLDRAIERFNREKSGRAATVSVYKNYSPDIPPIRFDAELLERVFSNLLLNAAQASPAESVVTVKTRLADSMVEISVIDRGSGIDAKNLESIFNPFFTTKPDGVGLGLAISSKIVDEHGGQITVESSPGEGSVFHVILPAEGTQ